MIPVSFKDYVMSCPNEEDIKRVVAKSFLLENI